MQYITFSDIFLHAVCYFLIIANLEGIGMFLYGQNKEA